MKTYYIYHVPGVKIGCTSNLSKRMKDQGFTNWQILEQHDDIYIASDREIELQRQHGYRVDQVPYWKSVTNRHKWNIEKLKEDGVYKRLGENHRALSKEVCNEIRSKYNFRTYTQGMLAKEYGVSRSLIQMILVNHKNRYA